MGVDTKAVLSKDVKAIDIFNVITTKFDQDAKSYIEKTTYDNTESGFIIFEYKGENRNLFYCVTEDRAEGSEYNRILHTNLIVGMWGNSVEIITEIVKCFGGYIDENDCDDVDYFYVPKDDNFSYNGYVVERNKVIEILDADLKDSFKIQTANQIMKHKEDIKRLFV